MKKKKLFALLALFCAFALAASCLTGCTNRAKAENEPTLSNENNLDALIVSAKDGELLVTSSSGLYFLTVGEKAEVLKNGKPLGKNDLRAGMNVRIKFDGIILETYPARIPNAKRLLVESEGEDKISLYREAVEHIFEERKGKDFDEAALKTVALDLTKLSDLSAAEKSALEYLLRNYFYSQNTADVIRSTFDGLSQSGRTENSLVITLKSGKGKNSFSLSQISGSLGGYGYDSCKATLKNGEWQIDYGGSWIA